MHNDPAPNEQKKRTDEADTNLDPRQRNEWPPLWLGVIIVFGLWIIKKLLFG